MADEVVVKGASVSLTAVIPALIFDVKTHTLSQAPSGAFASSESNEILLESDIDASFASYTTPYKFPPYSSTPGTLMYQSLKSVSQLSELTNKNGEPVVLKKTTGTITCSVTVPAIFTPPSSSPQTDSTTTYDLDFSFTDAAQTLTKSD